MKILMICNSILNLNLSNLLLKVLRKCLLIVGAMKKNNLFLGINMKKMENIAKISLLYQKNGLENG
jgi:hypothetical protein